MKKMMTTKVKHDLDIQADIACENWVWWCKTRGFYVQQGFKCTLSKHRLTSERDAVAGADWAAMHLAYLAQPDTLDKKVFVSYYLKRERPIKTAAANLNISRQHFYEVLRHIRRRIFTTAQTIQDDNLSFRSYSQISS